MPQRYALVDSSVGYIWGVVDAADPTDACHKLDQELEGRTYEYEEVPCFSSMDDSGFFVHEVPAGYDCDDGQDQDQIDALDAYPLVAKLRRRRRTADDNEEEF